MSVHFVLQRFIYRPCNEPLAHAAALAAIKKSLWHNRGSERRCLVYNIYNEEGSLLLQCKSPVEAALKLKEYERRGMWVHVDHDPGGTCNV